MTAPDRLRELRATSDNLLRDLDVLAELEEQKRQLAADDPRLVETAERIRQAAARVLSLSTVQHELTERISAQAALPRGRGPHDRGHAGPPGRPRPCRLAGGGAPARGGRGWIRGRGRGPGSRGPLPGGVPAGLRGRGRSVAADSRVGAMAAPARQPDSARGPRTS
jgi:hypothetical protein